MEAFLASFGFIVVAEMGDKSQLVALAFATKYRVWQVLAGITVATLVIHAGSVVIGRIAGESLSEGTIAITAGIAFIVFAIWTLRGDTMDDDATKTRGLLGPFMIVTVAFFFAELGDKTMFATITVATRYDGFWGTWLGSTAGMVVADAIAIVAGLIIGNKLPERPIKLISAAIFLLFGVWMIADGVMS